MNYLHYIILSGFIIALASMAGVVLVKSHKKIAHFVEHNLMTLSALSVGIFLVTSVSLGHETIETLGTQKSLLVFSLGFILFALLQTLSSGHRHKGDDPHHTHEHTRKSALKILIGDAIHNVADGLLLVASFGASLTHGVSTAISIFLHETPQEISEFIVLKKSGYSTTEAAYKNFATALSIFVGIAIGVVFLETSHLQAYLLGVSASFFIGIIFVDLLPIKSIFKNKDWHKILGAFFLGILIMVSITSAFTHSHGEHEHEHHEHGQEHRHENEHKEHGDEDHDHDHREHEYEIH